MNFRPLLESKGPATLEGGFLHTEDGLVYNLRPVVDLLESVEATNDSSDDGDSYMVMGNVDTETLTLLGMKEAPNTPSVVLPVRPADTSPAEEECEKLIEHQMGVRFRAAMRLSAVILKMVNGGVREELIGITKSLIGLEEE